VVELALPVRPGLDFLQLGQELFAGAALHELSRVNSIASVADPDPSFHFDADPDPDPSFKIKAQSLEK
jgi:hypothetical protein